MAPSAGKASLSATGGSTNLTLSGVSGTFAPGEELLLHQSQAAPQAAGRIGVLAPAGVTGATSPAYDPE